MSSINSTNSEAFASELVEFIEDMFPLYYIHGDICSQSSATLWYVTRRERVNTVNFKLCFDSFTKWNDSI